jgi:ligand-binding sensor domain-containing protein/signal transduction histidine kinase
VTTRLFCLLRPVRAGVIPLVLTQALAACAGDFLVNTWGTEEGLPDPCVRAIAQTPDGYLWIGTQNGLARFDGIQFQTFVPRNTPQLQDATIGHLVVDSQGTMWIGLLDGGLVSWQAGVFKQEMPMDPGNQLKALICRRTNEILFSLRGGELLRGLTQPDGAWHWDKIDLPSNESGRCFAVDKAGDILCLSQQGNLFRLDGSVFKAVSARENLSDLASDPNGAIWATTPKDELQTWSGGSFQAPRPNTETGSASGIQKQSPKHLEKTKIRDELLGHALLAAEDGGFWVKSGARLRKYQLGRWVVDLQDFPAALEDLSNFSAVCPDGKGGFWSFGRDYGLFQISANGEVEEVTVSEPKTVLRNIYALFLDREGNLWAGSPTKGLVQFRKPDFGVIGSSQGLPISQINSVCEDLAGSLWIGTAGGGLNVWRSNQISNYDGKEDVKSVVCDSKNRLWLLHGEGLVKFGEIKLSLPFAKAKIWDGRAMMADHSDRLWFGADFDLGCWDGQTNRWFSRRDGFPKGRALSFAEGPQGEIWIGLDTGDLVCCRDNHFTTVRFNDGHPQAILALWADPDGSLWAGTRGGGLLHYEKNNFIHLTTRDGLPSDVICSILDDGQGHLWFGSYNGVFRADRSALNAFHGEGSFIPCKVFGRRDGLPTLECSAGSQPAACRGRDGRLWFATANGVAFVRPSEVFTNPLAPSVVIESVLVDGNPRPLTVDQHQQPQLELGPGRFTLEIKYAGLSFTVPEAVRFKYRLLGLDSAWRLTGNRRSVTYQYLPPGEYRFQVNACNNDGVWNETGAGLAVTVWPYYWQRRSYQVIAVALLLLGTAAGAFAYARQRARRRIEQLEREQALEKERTRVARDLHDELGAGLTEIGLIGRLAQWKNIPLAETEDYLSRITAKARELVTSLDEIVWSVNPKHDSVSALAAYFCSYAEQLLNLLPVKYNLEVLEPLPDHPLTSEQRHNLLMAFKEALTNIIRHSQATEINIRIAVQNQNLEIMVADNGKGFAQEVTRSTAADGLANMVRRLKNFGGQCLIESQPVQGTVIRFSLPLLSKQNL